MNGSQLVDEFPVPLREHVENNELLAAARAEQADTSQLKRLLLAEFQAQEAEFTTYSTLVARFHHEIPGSLFVFIADTLMKARRFLVQDVVGSVGMTADDMRQAPISPQVKRFTEFISWVALHAGAGEAALLARTDFVLWCGVCAPLADALRAPGIPSEVQAYVQHYAELPPEVADGAVEVVDFGLAAGEREEWVTRSAPAMEPLLRGFWHFVAAG
ncbi:hypothetical protein ACQPZF_23705 [Actinosynnema sp. CS-041913]|uniref:hypothetical protein n=1 Tax=Actinosynnema sp. CS-041913 TaxID=3239917 RepID=UPI003D8F68F5